MAHHPIRHFFSVVLTAILLVPVSAIAADEPVATAPIPPLPAPAPATPMFVSPTPPPKAKAAVDAPKKKIESTARTHTRNAKRLAQRKAAAQKAARQARHNQRLAAAKRHTPPRYYAEAYSRGPAIDGPPSPPPWYDGPVSAGYYPGPWRRGPFAPW